MYSAILNVHSLYRWLVLLLAIGVTAQMALRWAASKPWTEAARRAAVFLTVALDIQLLIGLILYGVSPVARQAMASMAVAMAEPKVRFLVVEHPVVMLLAVVLAHVGSVAARRAATDRAKFGRAAVFFGCSLGLLLWGIPWWRLQGA